MLGFFCQGMRNDVVSSHGKQAKAPCKDHNSIQLHLSRASNLQKHLESRFDNVSPENTLTILEVRNPSSGGSDGKVDNLGLRAEILRLTTNPPSGRGTKYGEALS